MASKQHCQIAVNHMPILQHKLVMKSIEALHDEALSLAPDTTRNHGADAPSAVLHAAAPAEFR